MKPSFNDGYYFKSVEKWEDGITDMLVSKRIVWVSRMVPVFVISGLCVAGKNWKVWIALAATMYVFVTLLTFLEEINENLRYVRHQLRAARDAVRAVNDQVLKYQDPEANFTIHDALESLNREWEDPG